MSNKKGGGGRLIDGFVISCLWEKYIASNLTKSKVRPFLYTHFLIFSNVVITVIVHIYSDMPQKINNLSFSYSFIVILGSFLSLEKSFNKKAMNNINKEGETGEPCGTFI